MEKKLHRWLAQAEKLQQQMADYADILNSDNEFTKDCLLTAQMDMGSPIKMLKQAIWINERRRIAQESEAQNA